MALTRRLNPVLVLCKSCRGSSKYDDRIAALALEDENGSNIFVRDVCVAVDCAALQVSKNFCLDHSLEFELAWRNQIPVRACHGCRVSVLDRFQQKQEVSFILDPSEETRRRFDVETHEVGASEVHDEDAAPLRSGLHAKSKRQVRGFTGRKRKSARTLRQISDRERMLALEWSYGNMQAKKMFLWKENKHRMEVEKSDVQPAAEVESEKSVPAQVQQKKSDVSPDEPLSICCVVHGCPRYAKSRDRCLFHSYPLRTPPQSRVTIR